MLQAEAHQAAYFIESYMTTTALLSICFDLSEGFPQLSRPIAPPRQWIVFIYHSQNPALDRIRSVGNEFPLWFAVSIDGIQQSND
jgi:hypothetical protein